MARRIGINALYLIPGGVGGTEIYLRSLLTALARVDSADAFFVYLNRESADTGLVPKAANFHARPQPIHAASRPARIAWEQAALPVAALRDGLDVLLNPGFTAPAWCGCPQVTVFHDLQHVRHPEHFRWFDLPLWRGLLFAAAHLSRRIIAVSEATRRDVLDHYRLPEGQVVTVLSGVDEEFFAIAARRRPEPFLLAVSTLHPHKNLDGLLRAFAHFRQSRPDYRLVVSGLHGFYTGPLHDLRDQLGLRDVVEFPGWIPRADLLDLFARAQAFVYPSHFEGFGLPVLEALAAGVPTACSAIEPLATHADNAALLFDPADPAAICDALLRLTSDAGLRVELARRGPLRAREFSWTSAARGTLAVLEAVAQGER